MKQPQIPALRPNAFPPGFGKGHRPSQQKASRECAPPEKWYEPTGDSFTTVEIVRHNAGRGYEHVITAGDVGETLVRFRREFIRKLERVVLAQMTRRKEASPCFGLQWGSTIYLYPMEADLTQRYVNAPPVADLQEFRKYGAKIRQGTHETVIAWHENTIRDFYLHNVLAHELGHIVDDHNCRAKDREAFANHFAEIHGYPISEAWKRRKRR